MLWIVIIHILMHSTKNNWIARLFEKFSKNIFPTIEPCFPNQDAFLFIFKLSFSARLSIRLWFQSFYYSYNVSINDFWIDLTLNLRKCQVLRTVRIASLKRYRINISTAYIVYSKSIMYQIKFNQTKFIVSNVPWFLRR